MALNIKAQNRINRTSFSYDTDQIASCRPLCFSLCSCARVCTTHIQLYAIYVYRLHCIADAVPVGVAERARSAGSRWVEARALTQRFSRKHARAVLPPPWAITANESLSRAARLGASGPRARCARAQVSSHDTAGPQCPDPHTRLTWHTTPRERAPEPRRSASLNYAPTATHGSSGGPRGVSSVS